MVVKAVEIMFRACFDWCGGLPISTLLILGRNLVLTQMCGRNRSAGNEGEATEKTSREEHALRRRYEDDQRLQIRWSPLGTWVAGEVELMLADV
jgi:hypothetical protein